MQSMKEMTPLRSVVVIGLTLCVAGACSQKSAWQNFMDAGKNAYLTGHYREAEKGFSDACSEAEKFGSNDARLAESLTGLARTYFKEQNYIDAESLCQRALAIREKALAPDDPAVVESMVMLANNRAYRYLTRFSTNDFGISPEAVKDLESLFKRAQVIAEKSGKNPNGVADSLNGLANLYAGDSTNEEEAVKLLKQTLEVREKSPAADDRDKASTMVDLGTVTGRMAGYTSKMEELRKAEKLLLQALAIQEKTLGAQHADLARTCDILGLNYNQQRKLKEAEAFYRRAISIEEKTPEIAQKSESAEHLISLYDDYDAAALLKPFDIGAYRYVPEVYKNSPKGFKLMKGTKELLGRHLVREYPYDYANISVVFPLAKARIAREVDLESNWGSTCKLTGDQLSRLPAINNLTGVPAIIIGNFSGGMNSCCTDYEIIGVGDKVTALSGLQGLHAYSFKFGDFHGDGHLEALGHDMTFAYWNASMADSPLPGVVLKYTPHGWKLSLDDMKVEKIPAEKIEKALARCNEMRMSSEKEYPPEEGVFSISSPVWAVMLNMIYAGHADDAWKFLDRLWPADKQFCSITENGYYLNKAAFKKSVKDQLRTSPYWKDLKVLNQGQAL